MEARSLASVNILAANPPQYPHNPSEKRHEPLTLYISRVPGTRDVILSPFKPQLKNVSVEDVASCLYYVHLEPPVSSDPFIPSPTQDYDNGRYTDEAHSPNSIPRKPLPDTALPMKPQNTPANSRLQPPPSGVGHNTHTDQRRRGGSVNSYDAPGLQIPLRPVNKAIPAHIDDLSTDTGPSVPRISTDMPTRKPLGPRPMVTLATSAPDKATPYLSHDHFERANGRDQMRHHGHGNASNRNSRSLSPRKNGRKPSAPFTLSLIRRDPSSGAQWNVGKISSHQVEELIEGPDGLLSHLSAITETSSSSSSSSNPPIDIQIETSGYAKFRGMPSRKNGGASARMSVDVASLARNAPSNGYFSRQVVMSYSKSWTSNLKDKFQRMEHAARKRADGRHDSEASIESSSSADSGKDTQHPVGNPDQPGMKPRGYVFASPWDGHCEFRTGNAGRSVRCLHFPDDSHTAYNPLVADLETQKPKSGPATLSELRFNLPNSDLFPTSSDDAKDPIRGHFNKFLKAAKNARRGDDDDDDDDDMISPFDVNLGGEKAGGGNRGKRAKLGKLIIDHDGLKMLDLLVAANMGLWWGAWERSF